MERAMLRPTTLAIAALFSIAALQTFAPAQGDANLAFEKKAYNYSEWTKGKFSEVVTVNNPARHIFLGGIGDESEEDGKILHPGDFYAQCKYAFYKIKKLLVPRHRGFDSLK
jgi:2-iminobutanoate/2-iminopropanoate deaminase